MRLQLVTGMLVVLCDRNCHYYNFIFRLSRQAMTLLPLTANEMVNVNSTVYVLEKPGHPEESHVNRGRTPQQNLGKPVISKIFNLEA